MFQLGRLLQGDDVSSAEGGEHQQHVELGGDQEDNDDQLGGDKEDNDQLGGGQEEEGKY